MNRARDLLTLESGLGLNAEATIQSLFDISPVIEILNTVYLASQFALLPLVLTVLWRRSRPLFVELRDTILITWMLAIPVFALLPTAPPRLAGIGLADTISSGTISLQSQLVTPLFNQFAALPSLHSGFALAVGLTVVKLAGERHWMRVAGFAWVGLVPLATVATGNHFVIDCLAGFAITTAGWWLGRLRRSGFTLAPRLVPN
jgi:hypothetical protein